MISEKQGIFLIRNELNDLLTRREELMFGKKEYMKQGIIFEDRFTVDINKINMMYQNPKDYVLEMLSKTSYDIYSNIKRNVIDGHFYIEKISVEIKENYTENNEKYVFQIRCKILYNRNKKAEKFREYLLKKYKNKIEKVENDRM